MKIKEIKKIWLFHQEVLRDLKKQERKKAERLSPRGEESVGRKIMRIGASPQGAKDHFRSIQTKQKGGCGYEDWLD
jgi:hypothetical protein